MTSITQEDVLLILKLLDESAFDELRLETGDFKLLARKSAKGISLEVPDPNLPLEKSTGSNSAAQGVGPAMDHDAENQGWIPIKAPILGTFYRTPKPAAPPYVEVGSLVDEEDPVCIIEVMKLFNTVKSGVRGRIAQICAEQGQMVEFQQTLFLVEKIPEEKEHPQVLPP